MNFDQPVDTIGALKVENCEKVARKSRASMERSLCLGAKRCGRSPCDLPNFYKQTGCPSK